MALFNPGVQGTSEMVLELLEAFADRGLAVVPHVAAALSRSLSGDVDAALEVGSALSAAQLSGLSALPDPLPLLNGLAERMDAVGSELDAGERELLLAAAVCVEDRTEVLLALESATMAEFIGGRLGNHLNFVAGHFSFADPRMRLWIHESATQAERTDVHALLQHAYAGLGRHSTAIWHQSLATLEGDAALVPQLLELSHQAAEQGRAGWALAVAREAASHAVGEAVLECRFASGVAALKLGVVADAVHWLGPVLDAPNPELAARALPGFVHAETLLSGEVPTVLLDRRREALLHAADDVSPQAAGRVRRRVARAVLLASGLCASRGQLEDSARLLRDAQMLVERYALDGLPLCAVRSWCALFSVPVPTPPQPCRCRRCKDGESDYSDMRVITEALAMGLEDDAGAGLRVLQAGPVGAGTGGAGGDRMHLHQTPTPLGQAYRAVASALLNFWNGDASRAVVELDHAMDQAPVGMPLSGLGVTVARRLDVVTTGKVGSKALALGAGCPLSASAFIRTGDLTDRALAAYFDGRLTEAATLGRLAAERSARGAASPLFVPGFDEMAQRHGGAEEDHPKETPVTSGSGGGVPGNRCVPRGHRLAAAARGSLLAAGSGHGGSAAFARYYRQAAETSAGLASHYERARTEFVIGRACLGQGRGALAREHLVVSADLFREAGTAAWQRSVETVLGSLPEESFKTQIAREAPKNAEAADGVVREPGGASREAGSPLDHCRTVWSGQLTERELEVAMLVVEGASNRQAAATLHVSVRTVEVHLGRVFMKLNVRSRVELSVAAHRMGSGWKGPVT